MRSRSRTQRRRRRRSDTHRASVRARRCRGAAYAGTTFLRAASDHRVPPQTMRQSPGRVSPLTGSEVSRPLSSPKINFPWGGLVIFRPNPPMPVRICAMFQGFARAIVFVAVSLLAIQSASAQETPPKSRSYELEKVQLAKRDNTYVLVHTIT